MARKSTFYGLLCILFIVVNSSCLDCLIYQRKLYKFSQFRMEFISCGLIISVGDINIFFKKRGKTGLPDNFQD